MSKNARIGVLASIVWIAAAYFISEELTPYTNDTFMYFTIGGILPVVLAWGVLWVRKAK